MTRSRGFIRREGARRRRRDAGDGEEREDAVSLKDASDDNKIYGAIASGQGTTTTNAKSSKDDDDE